jgi:hypothetical protein
MCFMHAMVHFTSVSTPLKRVFAKIEGIFFFQPQKDEEYLWTNLENLMPDVRAKKVTKRVAIFGKKRENFVTFFR